MIGGARCVPLMAMCQGGGSASGWLGLTLTDVTPGTAVSFGARGKASSCSAFRAVLPPASANSDVIRWGRVLLSHTLDAARSY